MLWCWLFVVFSVFLLLVGIFMLGGYWVFLFVFVCVLSVLFVVWSLSFDVCFVSLGGYWLFILLCTIMRVVVLVVLFFPVLCSCLLFVFFVGWCVLSFDVCIGCLFCVEQECLLWCWLCVVFSSVLLLFVVCFCWVGNG